MATASRRRAVADRTAIPPKSKSARKAKLSHTRRPEGMSLEAWQAALRRQFGRDQNYKLRNLGDEPFFSEFQVTNPESRNSYRVIIRGVDPGENHCTCPDFTTNTLGTCKHIEFTLARIEKMRGGKTALAEGFQPPYSEICLQYGARREVRFRKGSESPLELTRLAGKFFDRQGVLLPDAFARFDELIAQAARINNAELRCHDDVLGYVAELRDGGTRRERIQKAFPKGIRSAAFNDLVGVSLYDYQREGALFAANAGRCLIGDDMGLGKTVQAIAAAEIMARELGVERVLVICPTSLKHQWEREIARFTKRSAQVIGGPQFERHKQFEHESFFKITNYDTVHRDLTSIQKWAPDLVILDEAQRIKNWKTRAANTVKKIVSPYAIVLTGTPLENRLEELMSIVQFIDQHRLGPTFRFLHDHQVLDDVGRVVGYKGLDTINQTLEPILIRRKKDQVLKQLPARLDKFFFVPMTGEQMDMHTSNANAVAVIVQRWQRLGFLRESDQRQLMICLQNMRMSCDSTYLLDHATDLGVKADEVTTLLAELFEQPDTKVVIFSQWTRMHELVLRRFAQKGWGAVFFHGGVDSQKRKGLIDQFREDPDCRAFLSTDAGGVGLNLQHANVVINLDIPWNPAVLEQRIGRVHRMGQTQPVQVINFVSQGTIEEGMLSLLQFKKSLASGILDGGEKEVFLGGSRLKKFMESVQQVTQSIPAPRPESELAQPESAEGDAEEATDEGETPAVSPDGAAPGSNGVSTGSGGAGSENTGPANAGAPEASTAMPSVPPAGSVPAGLAAATAGAAVAGDPLTGLLQTGLQFLEQLARSVGSANAVGQPAGGPATGPRVIQNEQSGERFLQLPIPEPAVVERILGTLGTLLEAYRPRG